MDIRKQRFPSPPVDQPIDFGQPPVLRLALPDTRLDQMT